MIYTPEQLSQILSDAQISNLRNEFVLTPEMKSSIDRCAADPEAPALAKMMYGIGGAEGVMAIMNYWDIRGQVREYQYQYNVSGLVPETRVIRGREFTFTNHDDQLALLERDRPVLEGEVPRVVEFFLENTGDYDLTLSEDDDEYLPTSEVAIRSHARAAVHAEIWCEVTNWQREGDHWVGRAWPDGEEPIDPDKIWLKLNVGTDAGDDAESLYFVAFHRDQSRFPWIE